jgi:hypothetical protein
LLSKRAQRGNVDRLVADLVAVITQRARRWRQEAAIDRFYAHLRQA